MRAYGSYKFMAISGINKDLKSISETEKKKYKADINTAFWYNHLVMGKASFNVPNSFYDVCKALYTEYYNDTAWDGDEEYSRQSGFLVNTDFGWFPEKEQDIKSYIEFIFKTSKADVAELLSKCPKIKLKYDILRTAILEKFKFDIAEINN